MLDTSVDKCLLNFITNESLWPYKIFFWRILILEIFPIYAMSYPDLFIFVFLFPRFHSWFIFKMFKVKNQIQQGDLLTLLTIGKFDNLPETEQYLTMILLLHGYTEIGTNVKGEIGNFEPWKAFV